MTRKLDAVIERLRTSQPEAGVECDLQRSCTTAIAPIVEAPATRSTPARNGAS